METLPEKRWASSPLSISLTWLAVAAASVATAELGLLAAAPQVDVTAVWPPSGIALAAALLLGFRVWPGIALGALLSAMVAGASIVPALAIALGDTLEALMGAFLVRLWLGARNPLDRAPDIFRFAFASALLPTAIGTTLSMAGLLAGGVTPWTDLGHLWLVDWLADAVAILVITPLLLAWSQSPIRLQPHWRVGEAILLLVALFVVSQLVFSGWFHAGIAHYPVSFTLLPVLIWSAFRFGRPGTTAVMALITAAGAWGTTHGYGPFARDSLHESLLLLQTFLAIMAITALSLVAAITQSRKTEEALRAANRRLRMHARVIENSPDMVSVIDRRYVYHMVNPAYAQLHGKPERQIVGHSLEEVLDREHVQKVRPHLEECFAGALVHYEHAFTYPRLGLRYVDVHYYPLQGDGARVEYAVAMIRDITERKQAEAVLRESEQRFRMLADTAPVMIWMAGADALCNFFNKPWLEFTGRSLEQELGNGWSESVHPDDYQSCLDTYLSAFHARQRFQIEYQLKAADGLYRWVLDQGIPRFLGDGSFAGYIGSCIDITERKQQEQERERLLSQVERERQRGETLVKELQRTNSTLRTLIDTLPAGVVVCDSRGAVTLTNLVAESILGPPSLGNPYSPQDHYALYRADGSPFPAEELPFSPEVCVKAASKGVEIVVRIAGRETTLLAASSPVRDINDQLVGGVVVFQDITERKHIERLQNEMISTISHELRTPLTSIAGSLGLAVGGAAGELPERARDMIDIAYRNSKRLVTLINEFLDLQKIESDRIALMTQAVDIGQILQEAIELNRAYAEQYEVKLVLEAAPQRLLVRADPDRLTQVVTNLLSNAAKFSPPGETVMIRVAPVPAGVRVSISDRGPGIPEEVHHLVFQKFAQISAGNGQGKPSTGLGLSIAKAIVEKLSGRIGFDTRPGEGTTFYFELAEWTEG